jgi:uncharacterized Tic20 family protein
MEGLEGVLYLENSNLYIPMGLKKKSEYFTGFGRSEALQSVVTIAITNIINLIIFLIIRSTLISSVFFLTSMGGSIMFFTKDVINLSIYDRLCNLYTYIKSQKKYEYVALDEWRG